ncbi:mitochondrial fission 1 protein A [Tanacetum coccineum]
MLWDCKFACSSENIKLRSVIPSFWALVHSRDSNDVRRGMGMLHGSLTSTSKFWEKKKELYLLVVGYLRCHNHTFYRMKYTQSISIRPVHISWDSILMMVSCLIVGAYTKWIGGALSGLSFLPSVIGILVSGISMSEDSAVAAALAFRTFVMSLYPMPICRVEERIVGRVLEGIVVHIQGVRTVLSDLSGAISEHRYGLCPISVTSGGLSSVTYLVNHEKLNYGSFTRKTYLPVPYYALTCGTESHRSVSASKVLRLNYTEAVVLIATQNDLDDLVRHERKILRCIVLIRVLLRCDVVGVDDECSQKEGNRSRVRGRDQFGDEGLNCPRWTSTGNGKQCGHTSSSPTDHAWPSRSLSVPNAHPVVPSNTLGVLANPIHSCLGMLQQDPQLPPLLHHLP